MGNTYTLKSETRTGTGVPIIVPRTYNIVEFGTSILAHDIIRIIYIHRYIYRVNNALEGIWQLLAVNVFDVGLLISMSPALMKHAYTCNTDKLCYI